MIENTQQDQTHTAQRRHRKKRNHVLHDSYNIYDFLSFHMGECEKNTIIFKQNKNMNTELTYVDEEMAGNVLSS
jgi:uncharacterized protein with PIN domain